MLKLVQKKTKSLVKKKYFSTGKITVYFFQIHTLIFLLEPCSQWIQQFEKTCIFYDWNESDKISQKTLR